MAATADLRSRRMALEERIQRIHGFCANSVPARDVEKVMMHVAEIEELAEEYDLVQQLIENGVTLQERAFEDTLRAAMEDTIMSVRASLQALLLPKRHVAASSTHVACCSEVRLPTMSLLKYEKSVPFSNQPAREVTHPSVVRHVSPYLSFCSSIASSPKWCLYCQHEHPLSSCLKYCRLPLSERIQIANAKEVCNNCLQTGHLAKNCATLSRCTLCGERHHILLHHFAEPAESKSVVLERPEVFMPSTPGHAQSLNVANPAVRSGEKATLLRAELFELLQKGDFEIRLGISKSVNDLRELDETQRGAESEMSFALLEAGKTLGISWFPQGRTSELLIGIVWSKPLPNLWKTLVSEIQLSLSSGPEAEQEKKQLVSSILIRNIEVFLQWLTFTYLIKVTSCCKRFFTMRRHLHRLRSQGWLRFNEDDVRRSVREREAAEDPLTLLINRESFAEELRDLQVGKQMKSRSSLRRLTPVPDNASRMVDGLLKLLRLAVQLKHPALQPNGYPLAQLIVLGDHTRLIHGERRLLLPTKRFKFRPLRGGILAKNVTRRYIRCAQFHPTFAGVGSDYAVSTYLNPAHWLAASFKTYMGVCMCIVIRKMHLDLVVDPSIEGLQTPCGGLRRGEPFPSTSNRTMEKHSRLLGRSCSWTGLDWRVKLHRVPWQNRARNRDSMWHPILPRAPYIGGLWEAAVEAAKRNLLGQVALDRPSKADTSCCFQVALSCSDNRQLAFNRVTMSFVNTQLKC